MPEIGKVHTATSKESFMYCTLSFSLPYIFSDGNLFLRPSNVFPGFHICFPHWGRIPNGY